jgi:protein O-GlcNAc transferase
MSDRPFEMAQAHHRAGRLADAQASYRQALAADPNNPAIVHLLGIVTCQMGDAGQGVELLERAAAAAPGVAEYQNNLGSALAMLKQNEKAIAAYRRALAINPNYPEAFANLADALCDANQLDEAVTAGRQAVALRPEYAAAHNNLGRALREHGFLDDAIACFRRASELNPANAEIFSNLSEALLSRGKAEAAISAARRALQIRPDHFKDCIRLGQALVLHGDSDEAVAVLGKLAASNPGNSEAQNSLALALQSAGDIRGAIAAFTRGVELDPANPAINSNLVYSLHFDPDSDAKSILQKHLEWNERHAIPLRSLRQSHSNDPTPDRKLRIGYVSPDFCKHVVGRNVLPLLRHRDAGQFEVFCYSNTIRPDSMTEQFQAYVDGWRDIVGVPAAHVAQTIRDDRIDILLDLALHMRGNRILIFAHKPAPVQVTFAGYPSGTGLETMDWRITDPYLDPPGKTDAFYREKSTRLPDSFWCYDFAAMELDSSPAVQDLPAKSMGRVTFGFLGNFVKTNDVTFRLWSKVLAAVPDSRLILMSPAGEHRQRAIRQLGIDSSRIEFVSMQPRNQYLAIFNRIDIGLDTFPYNGHTTSLDAMWMAVPVVSLRGQTAVSRAGYSQAKNVGLAEELIAQNPEEFVKKAVALASDLNKLADLRATLRQRMQGSPLMDAKRFTRNFESALREIWRQYCASVTPR